MLRMGLPLRKKQGDVPMRVLIFSFMFTPMSTCQASTARSEFPIARQRTPSTSQIRFICGAARHFTQPDTARSTLDHEGGANKIKSARAPHFAFSGKSQTRGPHET
jgi:hypothetical protein